MTALTTILGSDGSMTCYMCEGFCLIHPEENCDCSREERHDGFKCYCSKCGMEYNDPDETDCPHGE